MDNISKISQLNPYDTAVDESISIYLSFNSSMADRTVENEDNFFEREEDRENQGTVIKRSIEMTPMRKSSKSILQEINVFSSTPTQKGGVDQIQLGMAALGLAPLDDPKDEGKQANNLTSREENLSTISEKTLETTNGKQKVGEDCDGDKTIEDNKSENVVTVSSSSDSSNAPSIIVIDADSDNSPEKSMKDENKNIREEMAPVEGCGQISEMDKNVAIKEIISEKFEAPVEPVINTSNEENKENLCKVKLPEIDDGKKRNSGAVPKVKKESPYDTKVEVPAVKRMSTYRLRKSLMPCEPDLNSNRPSRIETNNKRLSTNSSKRSSILPTTTSIPRLLLKALGGGPPMKSGILYEKDDDRKKATLSRNSMIPPPHTSKSDLVKRPTLLTAPSNKRQTVFAVPSYKRLSVIKQKICSVPELSPRGLPKKSGILKTTLNSSGASGRSIRKSLNNPVTSNSKLFRSSLLPPSVKNINSTKLPKEANKISTVDPKKNQQIKSAAPSSNAVFSCNKCPRTFRLLTSLEAHRVLHDVTVTTATVCKYCDKKFAISKALTNHLLEKCIKIPTFERKKLLFPPATSQNDKSKGGNSSTVSNKSIISRQNATSVESATLETTPPDSKEMRPPSSSSKGKSKIPPAHSGVYRTPNKPVVCYPCKKNFDDVLGFTEHMVSHHSGSDVDS